MRLRNTLACLLTYLLIPYPSLSYIRLDNFSTASYSGSLYVHKRHFTERRGITEHGKLGTVCFCHVISALYVLTCSAAVFVFLTV